MSNAWLSKFVPGLVTGALLVLWLKSEDYYKVDMAYIYLFLYGIVSKQNVVERVFEIVLYSTGVAHGYSIIRLLHDLIVDKLVV